MSTEVKREAKNIILPDINSRPGSRTRPRRPESPLEPQNISLDNAITDRIKTVKNAYEIQLIEISGKLKRQDMEIKSKDNTMEILRSRIKILEQELDQSKKIIENLNFQLPDPNQKYWGGYMASAENKLSNASDEMDKITRNYEKKILELTEKCEQVLMENQGLLTSNSKLKARIDELGSSEKKDGSLHRNAEIVERFRVYNDELDKRGVHAEENITKLELSNRQMDSKIQRLEKELDRERTLKVNLVQENEKLRNLNESDQGELISNMKNYLDSYRHEINVSELGYKKVIRDLEQMLSGYQQNIVIVEKDKKRIEEDHQRKTKSMTTTLKDTSEELNAANALVEMLKKELGMRGFHGDQQFTNLLEENAQLKRLLGEDRKGESEKLAAQVEVLKRKLIEERSEKEEYRQKIVTLQDELSRINLNWKNESKSPISKRNSETGDDLKTKGLVSKYMELEKTFYDTKTKGEREMAEYREICKERIITLEGELRARDKYIDGQMNDMNKTKGTFGRERQKLEEDFRLVNEEKNQLLQEIEELNSQINHFKEQLAMKDSDLRAIRKMFNFGGPVRLVNKQNSGMIVPQSPTFSDKKEKLVDDGLAAVAKDFDPNPLAPISTGDFYIIWRRSDPGDDKRGYLLLKALNQPELREQLWLDRLKFLRVLDDSVKDEEYFICDNGVILIDECIHEKQIKVEELLSLDPGAAAIRALSEKHEDEVESSRALRYNASLRLLEKLDSLDYRWSPQMSTDAVDSKALKTLLGFLYQSSNENKKKQAANILTMMAEARALSQELLSLNFLEYVVMCMMHDNIEVRNQAAEALALFSKLENVRNALAADSSKVRKLFNLFNEKADEELLQYIMVLFINLSLQPGFRQEFIADGKAMNYVWNFIDDPSKSRTCQFAIRLLGNLFLTKEIRIKLFLRFEACFFKMISNEDIEIKIGLISTIKRCPDEVAVSERRAHLIQVILESLQQSSGIQYLKAAVEAVYKLLSSPMFFAANSTDLLLTMRAKDQGLRNLFSVFLGRHEPELFKLNVILIEFLFSRDEFIPALNALGKPGLHRKLIIEMSEQSEFDVILLLARTIRNFTRDVQLFPGLAVDDWRLLCKMLRIFEFHARANDIYRVIFFIYINLSTFDQIKDMLLQENAVEYIIKILASKDQFPSDTKSLAFSCLMKLCITDSGKGIERKNPIIERILQSPNGFALINILIHCIPAKADNAYAMSIVPFFQVLSGKMYQVDLISAIKTNSAIVIQNLGEIYRTAAGESLLKSLDGLFASIEKDREIDLLLNQYIGSKAR